MKKDTKVRLTIHAKERAKERLNMNEEALMIYAQRAFYSGRKMEDIKGNLRKYIKNKLRKRKKGDSIRVHDQVIYIFQFNVLITVYPINENLATDGKGKNRN